MVEAGANEIPEAEILDALDIAHDAIKKLVAAQVELKAKAGKPTIEFTAPGVSDELYAQVKASHGEALSAATSGRGQARPAERRPKPSRPRSSSSTPATRRPRDIANSSPRLSGLPTSSRRP